jgi:iron complex outermembrane receptor protein
MKFTRLSPIAWACTPIFTAIITATTTLVSPTAMAQEREDQLFIEEIIVTAQKREQNVQSVPIAITALTTELQEASIRNISDLNAYLPNVVIGENSVRARSSSIIIRGISYSESDKSFDSPIAVSLDGVFIGTSSGQIIENFDVERIEVLRGPQGTLFGKNTVGGVVSVIRTRPTGELGGDFQLTYGDWDTREFRGVANLPKVGDMLSTKLFYNVAKSDGHMRNTTLNRDGPERDYTNYGIALLLEPNDRFDALLTIETYDDGSDLGAWNNQNDESDVVCNPFDLFRPENTCKATDTGSSDTKYSTNNHNPGQYDTDAVTLNMSFDINDQLRLVSVTGWRDEDEDTTWEYDGNSFAFIEVTSGRHVRQVQLRGWGVLLGVRVRPELGHL